MQSYKVVTTQTLEAAVNSATSQTEKEKIVEKWLNQFPGLVAQLKKNETSYYECKMHDFVKLIIEQYLSPERCQLVTDLLTGRTEEEGASLLRVLTNYQTYQPIATADLRVMVGVSNTCKYWQLDRIVYIMQEVYRKGAGEIGLIPWSKTHADFFKLFLDNMLQYAYIRKFDSEMIRRFFKVLRLPEENLRHLLNLGETMNRAYYNSFFFQFLTTTTTPYIREYCSVEEGIQLLPSLPYLMLVEDEDGLSDPAVAHFVNLLRQHDMASKEYSVSQYLSDMFASSHHGKSFADYRWTRAVLAAMTSRVRNGKDLLTAVIELIIKSEGRALPKMGLCFPTAENPDLTLLETMVFDYPQFLEELYNFRIDREYMQDHFVKFAGYEKPEAAREVLKQLRIARLYLLNAGKNPAETFNMLQSAGVFEELASCDPASENLRMLTTVPDGEDHYMCPFFEANTLIYAHDTEYNAEQSLLQAILSADTTRFRLIIRAMCLFIRQYTNDATEENMHECYIQLCKDFISSGLMECIMNLNPPALIAELKQFDIALDRGLEIIMDDLTEPVSSYPNQLQIIALNMMLRAMDVATPYLVNMEHNQQALTLFISFLAGQFKSFVKTIGKDDHDKGKFKLSTEERALAFLRTNKKAQYMFECQIRQELEELGLVSALIYAPKK